MQYLIGLLSCPLCSVALPAGAKFSCLSFFMREVAFSKSTVEHVYVRPRVSFCPKSSTDCGVLQGEIGCLDLV